MDSNFCPKNIVIRMPNWLGDAVMATPVLEDVRKKYPQAKITALCQASTATLLAENPHVDEFLTFSRNKESIKDVRETLKRQNFDLGILLTGSFSSAWWFYKANIPVRLGYKMHFRSLLLTDGVDVPKNYETQHLVITYKQILLPLGVPVSDTAPELFLTAQEKLEAEQYLEEENIYPENIIIGINPGAAYGSAKCWPEERFRELTKRLLTDPKVRVIYFGDKTSKPLVDKICEGLSPRVMNLANKTNLRELMALIFRCGLFITNDSGPMHIASAIRTPLVAIFGSTNEIKTGPYGGGRVIHKHVPCSPCYLRKCPIDFRCMMQITVDDVIREVCKEVPLYG
jgi:heptosyltransferase II